jgi:hypothetical protein
VQISTARHIDENDFEQETKKITTDSAEANLRKVFMASVNRCSVAAP